MMSRRPLAPPRAFPSTAAPPPAPALPAAAPQRDAVAGRAAPAGGLGDGPGFPPSASASVHPGALACDIAGVPALLLPERALWWPGGATLFVADLHLGKAATFRARGLPVPAGTTQHNLAQLSHLLQRCAAQRLVVLGDFLHAAEAQSPALLAQLAHWRAAHPALQVLLVRGNHDRHAGDPPAPLALEGVNEPFDLGPFACCHHPQRHATRAVLAGHVHPAVQLRGAGRDALRLPCFCIEHPQEGQGSGAAGTLVLLPSFGAFTGSHTLAPAPGRRLFAAGAGRVWAVPPPR